MLNVPVSFPHVGCTAFFDDIDHLGNDIVEQVRIIARKGDDALISIRSRRYRHEIASGNRTVPLSALREHEQAAPAARPPKLTPSKPSGRTKGRRR